MNRDFSRINTYLNRLLEDVYGQPEDPGHAKWARDVFENWFEPYSEIKALLDVGCGDDAFMRKWFEEEKGVKYTGIAIKTLSPNVINMDFSFLDFPDNSFDCILSRHSLEHSPMPLLTLMEWYRVSRAWLCVILPNPVAYGWAGLNHYSVMHPNQIEFLLGRAGWNPIWSDFSEPTELRYFCEKNRKSEYEKATE